MTRIVATGGRKYADAQKVREVLGALKPTCVAQGGALGADSLVRAWCAVHGVWCLTYEADWHTDGKSAGPIRNGRMLRQFAPDVVVAFPGGRGTSDCVRQAKAMGIKVMEVVS
jgi:hypothetical protein